MTNDYTKHRLEFVSHMNDSVEALGYVYEAMPGSPWGVEMSDMIIRITEMIDQTNEELTASGVINCHNCNGRTAPIDQTFISEMRGTFCNRCTAHYTRNKALRAVRGF